MLLNKHNLAIAALASKEESRYALCGIQITARETVVTDGHQLVRVTTPTVDQVNFPVVPGLESAAFDGSFILQKAQALAIAKAIPKVTRRNHIPILTNAVTGRRDEERNSLQIAVTDLDTPQVFDARGLAGQFPSVDLVCTKREAQQFSIAFNLDVLLPVLKQASEFKAGEHCRSVVLRFYGDGAPIRIDAVNTDTDQHFMGVVMPLRLEDGAAYDYPGFDPPAVATPEEIEAITEISDSFEADTAVLTVESHESGAIDDGAPFIAEESEDGFETEAQEGPPASLAGKLCPYVGIYNKACGEPATAYGYCETHEPDEAEIMAERAALLLMQYDRFTVSPFARDLWQAISDDFDELMQWALTGERWLYPDDCEAQLDRLAARIQADAEIISLQPMMAGAILNAESALVSLVA